MASNTIQTIRLATDQHAPTLTFRQPNRAWY